MDRCVLTDTRWDRIAFLLPGKEGDPGRTGEDNRLFVEAVLWLVRTGSPWRDLPESFGLWHRRKRGTQNQAIGRSRGGLTTRIPALVDALGNLVRFILPPGQRHDSVEVGSLIEDLSFGAFLADKAFDSDRIRGELEKRNATAVIPPKNSRKADIHRDYEISKRRHLVENFFCKIKEYRRIATRYDKKEPTAATARSYISLLPCWSSSECQHTLVTV